MKLMLAQKREDVEGIGSNDEHKHTHKKTMKSDKKNNKKIFSLYWHRSPYHPAGQEQQPVILSHLPPFEHLHLCSQLRP